MLSSLTSNSKISNVLIFISDSHRFDHLPTKIKKRGVTCEAISASTFTASGLPSILTGRLPSDHQVWDFNDQLERKPALLANARNEGFNAETIWTDLSPDEKPPLKIHRMNERTELNELETPFVHIYHDKGGHSPYGRLFEESNGSRAYFEQIESIESAQEDYAASLQDSADRFISLLSKLEKKDVLSETLAVFCSDHGEFIGERKYGHLFGHGHPMAPPTVRVPVVFCGAGLEPGVKIDDTISTTDIAPTAMDALGWSLEREIFGESIWDSNISDLRPKISEVWKRGEFKDRGYSKYAATGAWKDGTTGVVYHQHSPVSRATYALGTHLYTAAHAPLTRSQSVMSTILKVLQQHTSKKVLYGAAHEFPSREAVIRPFEVSNRPSYEVDEDQLKKLGYK